VIAIYAIIPANVLSHSLPNQTEFVATGMAQKGRSR
jgi:hypothetical protein